MGRNDWLYWSEPARALADYQMFLAASSVMAQLPRGDGHPVLVLPGLLADNESTAVLRSVLRDLGYRVDGWALGRNVGPSDASFHAMRRQLRVLTDSCGARVTLIGCSLGGFYARELARDVPGAVRQVITLGTPLGVGGSSRPGSSRPALKVPGSANLRPRPLSGRRPAARAVPHTSIYSQFDGVVDWRQCLDAPGEHRQNVAVTASHIGISHHPGSLWVIADRLAQQEGTWQPFQAPSWWQQGFSLQTPATSRRPAAA